MFAPVMDLLMTVILLCNWGGKLIRLEVKGDNLTSCPLWEDACSSRSLAGWVDGSVSMRGAFVVSVSRNILSWEGYFSQLADGEVVFFRGRKWGLWSVSDKGGEMC